MKKTAEEYVPNWGENINTVAENIVAMANKSKKIVVANFNDIALVANPDDRPETIVDYYKTENNRRHEEYKNSPAGKKAAREQAQKEMTMQEKCDALMLLLPGLDFTDDVALLDWLCEFQGPSDHIGVKKEISVVISTFATHGYYSGVNTGEDFKKDNRDNFARYIIGQALSCLQEMGAIHPMIISFTNDWKKIFCAKAS